MPAATAKGYSKLVTYSWAKVRPATDPGRIHFRGIQGLGMSGMACNRLDLQGLADHDAETRAVKPKLRPKAETETSFALYRRASIHICTPIGRYVYRDLDPDPPRTATCCRCLPSRMRRQMLRYNVWTFSRKQGPLPSDKVLVRRRVPPKT